MEKTLTAIMITMFFLTPTLCFSAYRIHLKDGREFVTDQYFEEGDLIKFKRYGGLIGIPKALISTTEQTETDSEAEAPKPALEERAPQQATEKKAET